MSSLTKSEFATELMSRNGTLSDLGTVLVQTYIDIALRAYSGKLPQIQYSQDNEVVTDQTLYDFPDDAITIVGLRCSTTEKDVIFGIEDQGNGKKIRIGSIKRHSYDDLLASQYYLDPLLQESDPKTSVINVDTGIAGWEGYSSFDIEYVLLQDMGSINERGLEALSFYVEYLGYSFRASQAAEGALDDAEGDDTVSSITDTDSTGATTTVSFTTKEKVIERFNKLAESKLESFNDSVSIPFGIRA